MAGVTSLNDKAFVKAAAEEERRVDGRPLLGNRQVRVSLLEGGVGAEVRIGHSRCIAHVQAEIVKPSADKRSEGVLQIELHTSAMGDPAYEPNRIPESIKQGRAAVQKALVKSKAVDLESLCVIPGKAVWSVRVEVRVLDNGGNLTDTALLAAAAALKGFKRNDVTTVGDTVKIHSHFDREPLPLTLYALPLSATFGVLDVSKDSETDRTVMISDPSLLEEQVLSSSITVIACTTDQPVLYGILKSGGCAVETSLIQHACSLAVQRSGEMRGVLEGALKARDDSERHKGRKREVLDTLWQPPPSCTGGFF
mmetsp:Transcript_22397/g.53682  ORF Transcript_22397/g.53682 Transcript_22397/m.53682 type:complete len:310 (+) Transcript_22397:229-1158(+)